MTIVALKRVVVIKGVSIHISTFPSPYSGDVRRHNLTQRILNFSLSVKRSNVKVWKSIGLMG